MKVAELISVLHLCNPETELRIIQQEELECFPEWWDDNKGEYGGVISPATELYSEDVHSHRMYLLAIEN